MGKPGDAWRFFGEVDRLTSNTWGCKSATSQENWDMGVSIVMGVSKMVGLFHGKSHRSKWMMTGEAYDSGNHHMCLSLCDIEV